MEKENTPPSDSFIFSDEYLCRWELCGKNFMDAEQLYEHLRDDHVGRKAHRNLCLTCRWEKCSIPTFTKRDHITSHLRVHVPSKPYHCSICKKGFKRPQDLKKHERTHLDGNAVISCEATDTKTTATASTSGHLKVNKNNSALLTPPTISDRSPSISSTSTLTSSATLSPYSLPLSPADTLESWNPGLSSPSYSTNSDLFSSPNAQDLEFDMLNVDTTSAYYGALPINNGCDDLSLMSAKRPRDGLDEILSETLDAFANEAKKKCTNAYYNEDVMGYLNAMSVILEDNPLTPERLLSSLPDITDLSQYNQLNQYCSSLLEDVSGESHVSKSFDMALFPEYDQKQATLEQQYINNFGNGAVDDVDVNRYLSLDSTAAFNAPSANSLYGPMTGNDVFTSGATNDSSWDSSPGLQPPGVIQAIPVNRGIQQHNRFNNPQYVTLQALQQGADSPSALVRIKKEEDVIEPKIEVKEEGARLYADMATQTGANTASQPETFSGAMMMMVMPSTLDQTKRMSKARVPLDAEALLESAPNAPDMPLLGIDIKEAVSAKGAASKEVEETSQSGEQQSIQEAVGSEDRGPGLSKFGSYVQKARARQAAAAAAAASASATNSTLDSAATIESLDPMEAMTRQFEQTRLSGSDDNHSSHNAPATDLDNEDEERRLRAAKARTLCAQDPVRRQHAKVLWNLIKSFNFLMAHPEKVAQYRAALSKGSSSGVYRKTNAQSLESGRSSTPHRGDASSTAGSTSIAPHRPSPLHQEYKLDFDYNRLRSALLDEASSYHPSPPPVASQAKHTKDTGSETETYEQSIDSPVLYPTSDLHHSSVPFELSEEERRFIEEDNARTAAAKAAASNEAETESDSEYCIV